MKGVVLFVLLHCIRCKNPLLIARTYDSNADNFQNAQLPCLESKLGARDMRVSSDCLVKYGWE
jgi:hypothetical protein